jgi:hypothetical protein
MYSYRPCSSLRSLLASNNRCPFINPARLLHFLKPPAILFHFLQWRGLYPITALKVVWTDCSIAFAQLVIHVLWIESIKSFFAFFIMELVFNRWCVRVGLTLLPLKTKSENSRYAIDNAINITSLYPCSYMSPKEARHRSIITGCSYILLPPTLIFLTS